MAVVLMTGGGSGGHITPALAVAHELKQLDPATRIVYVGQTGDSLDDVPRADPNIDEVVTVRAGKFRRYHGEGWRQLLDLPTLFKNMRDGLFVVIGIFQSYALLKRIKPVVIFTRGSFVSVPVALAAAWLKIPYITHDSDAIPSLANRIIARWATIHAVALPKEVYPYPADKTVTVGVPVSHKYHLQTVDERQAIKQGLGFAPGQKVMLVTGGGLGALRLNQAVIAIVPELLQTYPGLAIVQLTGRLHEDEVNAAYDASLPVSERSKVQVKGFVGNLYDYSAVADVVVTRAGGTSIAEFAAQAKACIIVPNPILTGGHQTKNAKVLADRQAAVLLTEDQLHDDAKALLQPVQRLLDNPAMAKTLGHKLHDIAQPDAARRLGVLLLNQLTAK